MTNPYAANFEDRDGVVRLQGQVDFTDPANQPGGSQPFVRIDLRHSADFANVTSGAPVTAFADKPQDSVSLPPSLFGNNSIIDVKVGNATAGDVLVGGVLVVQSADGTVWIEQDTSADQMVAAGAELVSIDFDTNGGSAGAGLSWNSGTKQVDIASAGVYSAFVSLYATPT